MVVWFCSLCAWHVKSRLTCRLFINRAGPERKRQPHGWWLLPRSITTSATEKSSDLFQASPVAHDEVLLRPQSQPRRQRPQTACAENRTQQARPSGEHAHNSTSAKTRHWLMCIYFTKHRLREPFKMWLYWILHHKASEPLRVSRKYMIYIFREEIYYILDIHILIDSIATWWYIYIYLQLPGDRMSILVYIPISVWVCV